MKNIKNLRAVEKFHVDRIYTAPECDCYEAAARYDSHKAACYEADLVSIAGWIGRGYSLDWESSGEVDSRGEPMSGPVTTNVAGVRLVVGSWGPTSGETWVYPPEIFTLEVIE